MTISSRLALTDNDSSTSSTSIPIRTPGTVNAGEVWIIQIATRGGSGMTVSGVPGTFTFLGRVDSGSASSAVVISTYGYLCLGTETGTFATITLSGASKHVVIIHALSGADMPTTANVVSGSGTTSASTSVNTPDTGSSPITIALPTLAAFQGTTTLSGASFLNGSASGQLFSVTNTNTTGGSSATNLSVQMFINGSGTPLVLNSEAPQTWPGPTLSSASTAALQIVAVSATAAPVTPTPIVLVGQAVVRAANW